MSYLVSYLIFSLKNYVKNAILGKDFNLGATSFFFMFSPLGVSHMHMSPNEIDKNLIPKASKQSF